MVDRPHRPRIPWHRCWQCVGDRVRTTSEKNDSAKEVRCQWQANSRVTCVHRVHRSSPGADWRVDVRLDMYTKCALHVANCLGDSIRSRHNSNIYLRIQLHRTQLWDVRSIGNGW